MLVTAEQANAHVETVFQIQEPSAPEFLIYNEAYALSYLYGVPQEFVPEIAILIKSGVLGKKAVMEHWDNIGEHCILAGKMALGVGWLTGLSSQECFSLTQQAYIHDAHLRREKEAKAHAAQVLNGIKRIDVGLDFYYENEMAHPGILQATSMDWRGYEDWAPQLQIMRYVDSCIGPVIGEDGTLGRDEIQHYSLRAYNLHQRKRSISEEVGKQLYGGVPAFHYLHHVTQDIETRLYNLAQQAHPELMGYYKNPSQFFNLVHDMLQDPTINWSLYLHYDTLSA